MSATTGAVRRESVIGPLAVSDQDADKVEVLGKIGTQGVYVRLWGAHDNLVARVDLTAREALLLANALIEATIRTQATGPVVPG